MKANHLPTILEIVAAARASAQKTPRPGAAFWRETIRSMVKGHLLGGEVLALTEARGWTPPKSANPSAARLAVFARLDGAPGVVPLPEADLRAVFVELQILASDDEDEARRRWGAVFGLGLEGS